MTTLAAQQMELRMATGVPFTVRDLRAAVISKAGIDLPAVAGRVTQRWFKRGWITCTGSGRSAVWRLTQKGRVEHHQRDGYWLTTADAAARLGMTRHAIQQSYQDGAPVPLDRYRVGGRGVDGAPRGRLPLPWVEHVKRIADTLGIRVRRAMYLADRCSFEEDGTLTVDPVPVAAPRQVMQVPQRRVRLTRLMETVRSEAVGIGG